MKHRNIDPHWSAYVPWWEASKLDMRRLQAQLQAMTDQSAAVVPSAAVVITNSGTGLVARTLKTGASTSFRRDEHSAYRSVPAPLDTEENGFFGQLEETQTTSGGPGEKG